MHVLASGPVITMNVSIQACNVACLIPMNIAHIHKILFSDWSRIQQAIVIHGRK